jgi:hypothetical protein
MVLTASFLLLLEQVVVVERLITLLIPKQGLAEVVAVVAVLVVLPTQEVLALRGMTEDLEAPGLEVLLEVEVAVWVQLVKPQT